MPYTFSASADRYRDTATGRFINRRQALEFVEQSLDAGKPVVDQFAQRVAAGDISPRDFRNRMREEIKGEHIRQYILGRGGVGSMAQEDWGRLGGMLKSQYSYLDGFYEEIRAGNLSEAQISARARMYVSAARDAYERGHRRAVQEGGYTEERWTLGQAEHCGDCVELAGRGWVEIGELGTTPAAGDTECRVNCKCTIIYR